MTAEDKSPAARALGGARLMVVEDDFILSMELESILDDAGAGSVELCRSVAEALRAAELDSIEAAVLDVRVGRESIMPVARRLAARGIPFVFYTGQVEKEALTAEWPECRVVSKPALPHILVGAVAELLIRASRSPLPRRA